MLLQLNDFMETLKYLFGASGHCKVIVDVLKSKKIDVASIFDDQPLTPTLVGIPVLVASKINASVKGDVIVSVGNNSIRKKIVGKINSSFFTAIHSRALVSNEATIDEGTVIMAGAIVNSCAKIGKHCIINTGAIVEHDCVINDYVHISPNVSLAGNVFVGEGSHIGIGSCIIQGVKIGKWVTVGAGAVIIKDIPDYAVVVGNPGRIIKYNKIDE